MMYQALKVAFWVGRYIMYRGAESRILGRMIHDVSGRLEVALRPRGGVPRWNPIPVPALSRLLGARGNSGTYSQTSDWSRLVSSLREASR